MNLKCDSEANVHAFISGVRFVNFYHIPNKQFVTGKIGALALSIGWYCDKHRSMSCVVGSRIKRTSHYQYTKQNKEKLASVKK